jgi:vacuolar protein sorting-associated protein 18
LENAEEVANTSDIDESLRKSLWLKLVRHVIEKLEDVSVYAFAAHFLPVFGAVSLLSFCFAVRALQVLKNCSVLKIDDVLALFPDFTVIESFKVGLLRRNCQTFVVALVRFRLDCLHQQEIVESLEESSKKLQDLREDMKDFTDSAERIRQDIKALRYRSVSNPPPPA